MGGVWLYECCCSTSDNWNSIKGIFFTIGLLKGDIGFCYGSEGDYMCHYITKIKDAVYVYM